MVKNAMAMDVNQRRRSEAAPVTLRFRTWGIDLLRERFDMPARQHSTRRMLRNMTAPQIYSAAMGMSFAAMQDMLPANQLRLMLVLTERLMKAAGQSHVTFLISLSIGIFE